jgi:hypothetical protein
MNVQQEQPRVLGRLGSVIIIPAGPEALGFIIDSWCRSFERPALQQLNLPAPERVPGGLRRMVCSAIHERVRALVARPSTRALVAVHEASPEVLLGHVTYEPEKLHYAYVLENVRHLRIASALVGAAGVRGGAYTHHTPAGASLVRRFHLAYTPQEA